MSETPPPFAEYPRPQGPGGFGYSSRGPGVYFDAIGEAWNIVRADLGTWVAGTIVLFLVSWAVSIPFTVIGNLVVPPPRTFDDMAGFLPSMAIRFVFSIIPGGVQFCLTAGLIGLGVRKLRGEYVNVGMMFDPFKRFGSMFLTGMLFSLVLYASIAACIIPSFFFAPVLMLMPAVAYLQNLGPVEALSRTFDACKSYWLGLLGLSLVMGLIQIAGVICCCVGILVALPVTIVILAIHYRAFFESIPRSTEPAPSPYV